MSKLKLARQLIIDAIKNEDTPTIEALKQRFFAEYGGNIERQGVERASIEWLMGLALHVPFYTYEIEKMGFEDGSEKGQYWNFLGQALRDIIRN